MTATPVSAPRRRVTLKRWVEAGDPHTAVDFLAARCELSKSALKDAMIKGAVWLTTPRTKKRLRLRRATAELGPGDLVELFFDDKILEAAVPAARCVADRRRYSVWLKPAGLLAQGTDFGDHCALARQVEKHFAPKRQVFLVHRLDREAVGLMLVAHDSRTADALSRLFRGDGIIKKYRAVVRGDLGGARGERGRIDLALDGKSALTEFAVTGYDRTADTASVEVIIRTGRLHQIRRHFDAIGFPVIGDPRYGSGNKNDSGLRLAAVALEFVCPLSKQALAFAIDPGEVGW